MNSSSSLASVLSLDNTIIKHVYNTLYDKTLMTQHADHYRT